MKTRLRWLTVLALIWLTGCGTSTGAGARLVDLVDLSGSARSPEVAQTYRQAFGAAVGYVGRRQGSVAVETIEANPIQHSDTPVAMDFALPKAVRSNPVYATPLLARRRTVAMQRLEQVLARPAGPPGSDVFASLLLAQRLFDESTAKDRLLVVCSDMLQSSTAYDFYARDLSDAEADRVITELRANHQLADLRGVSVWVVGAGRDATNEISSSRNQAVERFFRRYFVAVGAQVVSYGATLRAFPPLASERG